MDNVIRFPGRRVRWRVGMTISITDRLFGEMRWAVPHHLSEEQREFFERGMRAHMVGLIGCYYGGPEHQRLFEEKMIEASKAMCQQSS